MEAPNPLRRHLPALLLEARDITHILTQAEAPVNGDERTTKTAAAHLWATAGPHNGVGLLAKDVTVLRRSEPRKRSSCRSCLVRGTCCTTDLTRALACVCTDLFIRFVPSSSQPHPNTGPAGAALSGSLRWGALLQPRCRFRRWYISHSRRCAVMLSGQLSISWGHGQCREIMS